MISRLGGFLLVLLGLASGWFALAGEYEMLMNPAFRWVSVVGAGLLVGMGAVLMVLPHRGSGSAVAIFALFVALVAIARPHEGGVAPLLAPLGGSARLDRAGYEPLRTMDLFEGLDGEAQGIEERPVAVRGFVKRLSSLDAQQEFVLLEPLVACCLADAVAFGLRVQSRDGELPEDGSWVHAFGDLRKRPTQSPTPDFRVGAILFNPVSRNHVLAGSEVLPFEALLEDIPTLLPEEFCATFRELVADSELVGHLRDEGPITVFALHEAAFQAMPGDERDALRSDARRRTELLQNLTVPGRYAMDDLFDISTLTTLAGTSLPVAMENGRLRIGGARILLGPIQARNGLIYVVHPAPRLADR